MRIIIPLATLLLVGCRGDESRRPPAPVTADPWNVAAGSAQDRPALDPWATAPGVSSVPSLADRKRLADEACPTVTGPYFYRIEKAGNVSHILGTRHVGVPLTKFPRSVHDAIETATLAVFEVAPGDDSDLPDVELTLPDELGPTLWARYDALVGPDMAATMRRATPASALLMMMVMHEDISAMLDAEIERKVIEAGIPTRGLEKSAFQDKLLKKLLDLRMLRASIEQTEDRGELEKDSREDLTEYCAGTDESPGLDVDDRKEMIASGYTAAELDQMDEELVYARNADWIPKLEPMLDAGGAFIAVGADHLRGSRGVIELLRKRGYKSTLLK